MPRPVLASCALLVLPLPCAALAMSAPSCKLTSAPFDARHAEQPALWREIQLARPAEPASEPAVSEAAAADALVRSKSTVLLPGLASEAECDAILTAARHAVRETARVSGNCAPRLVRLPALAAGARPSAPLEARVSSDGASTLSGVEDAACEVLLRRVFERLDAELPTLVRALFGAGRLAELHAAGELEFSVNDGIREPAVNVYAPGGLFNMHKDGESLTVLLPLSAPADFTGGGTGFWAPHRWATRWCDFHSGFADEVSEEPRFVLRPERGTAMLFGGQVMHQGMPVEAGSRAVLVASFSRRRFRPRGAAVVDLLGGE